MDVHFVEKLGGVFEIVKCRGCKNGLIWETQDFASDHAYLPRHMGALGYFGLFLGVWMSVLSKSWMGYLKRLNVTKV